MVSRKGSFTASLPYQVLIAALLGILLGILIGDKAQILEPIGRIYTMLMEVAVFPYIISTLLTSLGNLSPSLSFRLFRKGWSIYLLLLILTYATLIILGKAIPINITIVNNNPTESAVEQKILNYLIPENVFFDLTNNYVPAVIIFCILFGLVLQHIPNKQTFFNILEIISRTCLVFWHWLVTLVPIATFALLAYISGTIPLAQLFDMGEFLILFFVGSLLLIFWIIPIVICSCTNIKYESLFYEIRDALIISAITTLSVVALPYLEKITAKFIDKIEKQAPKKETEDIIKTVLLVSYPLAQLGNFFVYLFLLFASLYFDHAIHTAEYFFLPLMTFISSIGSPSSSINSVEFLTYWLHLPIDTVNLYVALTPLIRYGQVLLSVMGFAFLGILVSFAFFGHLKINYKKMLSHLVIAFILLIVIVTLLKSISPHPGEKSYKRLNSFSLSQPFFQNIKAVILPPFDEKNLKPVAHAEDSLSRIQRTGVLRVGFNADMRPFAFFNNKQQLVGYDIAYAYALAKALNASIEFVPFTWQYLLNDMQADKFDIAMSAIYATEQRLELISFTDPYFHSPASLVVPKANQSQYETADQIKNIKNLRIGVFNDPVLIPMIRQNFPNAAIVILGDVSGEDPEIAFEARKIDAVFWSQAQTHVWVLAHPDYVSILPSGIAAPFLMAYMIQRTSPEFLHFLNYWLTLKKNDGFQAEMYNQWILIRPIEVQRPRWSLLQYLR